MKTYLFIAMVIGLLAITACSGSYDARETSPSDATETVSDGSAIAEEVDTTELDQLEEDLQAIEEVL